MATTQTNQMLAAAAAACEDKKAEDIRILQLDPTESGLTDYFLICNGTNERQNVAITDEIEIRLKKDFGVYPNSVEGRRQAEWILMDYVDFIVHVFSPEKREFYALERLRKSATSLSIEELRAILAKQITATRAKSGVKKVESTKVPAKSPFKATPKKAIVKKAASTVSLAKRAASKKAVPNKVVAKPATKKMATKETAKKPAIKKVK